MQKEKLQLIYILPNLFTAASCFFGVISILASINAQFEKALFYIILALICDGLDGRVARLTKTTSKFGVEFDSLADLIAFGVAPAVLFYQNIGVHYGKLGALVCAFFVIFGAIRLARFNVTSSSIEPSVFIGLPIPTAAVVSAVFTYAYIVYKLQDFAVFFLVLNLFLAFLMVSNIRYASFKKVDLSRANVLKTLVVLIIFFSLLYLYPLEITLLVVGSYTLYGPLRTAYTLIQGFKKFKKS